MTRSESHTDRAGGDRAPPGPKALPPLVAVMGPTASGKSALALALAEHLGGEVLSTDAMQVYRRFDIGTAKPGPEERARAPHHLIDVVGPDEAYSAGRYVKDARAILAELARRGRLPVLCGGTGLYFRALFSGLAEVPPVPGEVRAAVEAELARDGLAAGHRALAAVDPETAAAVHPHDPVRIARALMVCRATGRPLSAWHRGSPFGPPNPNVFSVGIAHPRSALQARIAHRVDEMLRRGWIEEVQGLLDDGYGPELKPMRAIGYKEITAFLLAGGGGKSAGELEELAHTITLRTRQYAKRQQTWFRKHPPLVWSEPGREREIIAKAKNFLEKPPAGPLASP